MLTNRISLRAAAAVGCATVVAGAAFGVSAFADSGASPEQAASAALPEDAPKAESQSEQEFFSDVEEVSDDQRASAREEAKERVEDAGSAAGASGTAAPEKKEEEKEESDSGDGGGSDSGGSAPPSGDPKGIAKAMLGDFGWSSDQFSGCLEPLWEKESNWNPSAQNPSSGAYGIPQALPGSKMATAGSDWQTNPATQIEWGLGYIEDRYGSPCEAWSHSQANGWY
ncbi:aggregation-promoting factor C-terminal-like domain-containing protein [Nocardiopsis suaedae]|uniref:Transglycosylase SLT domain-containing protein n=1 Tax=Nocardiopsis suaedae TaxID=3018444 RepID=A0ABT4TEQ0_9ACTN|nr:transglycosylase SLT domain-containing protein [Nocardiopsis suaedae]MDA2803159.1 transglycosylase SLT domain-containing protein [Nocardiopsis suaedae]